MASQILAFPSDGATAAGSPVLQGALAFANSAPTKAPEKPLGPALIYARPSGAANRADRTQAEHLNALLEDEISERVQREAAERRAGRITLVGNPQASAYTLPTQATLVRFRERLLDTLFFFTRSR